METIKKLTENQPSQKDTEELDCKLDADRNQLLIACFKLKDSLVEIYCKNKFQEKFLFVLHGILIDTILALVDYDKNLIA